MMYIFLYVLGGIIAAVLILSLVPVTLITNYNKILTLKFKFLGISFSPLKKNKNKGVKIKKDKKIKVEPTLKNIIDGINVVKDIVQRLPYRIIVKRLYLRITIVGEDAAQTAIEYGGVCSAIFGSLAFIQNFCILKDPDIIITPGFQEKAKHFEIESIIFTRLGNIILALIRFLVYSIRK